ncbi:MAG: ribulose-phosphate 3-epimerase [Blastocatellia bacterium]|nr:ribulose-phosphate 3-epimerase [Blastocatellia bacterium]
MRVQIAPSILSADFTRLGEQVKEVETAGAEIIHIDVMDGHFVPNISIGIPVVESLRRITNLPLDTHLMISNADQYVERFAKAGANMISVHVEAVTHIHRTLEYIKNLGCKAGVVLNPGTPLSTLDEILPYADFVLLMSVNPGFGGQKFIKSSLTKISKLKALIEAVGKDIHIEVDGGIDMTTAPLVVEAGAEWLVAGSAIFGAVSPAEAVKQMRTIANRPVSV